MLHGLWVAENRPPETLPRALFCARVDRFRHLWRLRKQRLTNSVDGGFGAVIRTIRRHS